MYGVVKLGSWEVKVEMVVRRLCFGEAEGGGTLTHAAEGGRRSCRRQHCAGQEANYQPWDKSHNMIILYCIIYCTIRGI